ncbi:hypothetical protein HZY62_14380 [Maribacter polysiphoniae]|nr:hypothetical protein [Maribacter polysiphoniae]MBD1261789.1 hypothetical protein [Maribacter polysiphoniae]
MNKLIIILSFLLATTQLSSQKKIDLTSDESLTKIFNKEEIEGLESIVRFVDNMVLKSTSENNPSNAYHLYFEEIVQTPEYIVPFKEVTKYQFLKNLDSTQLTIVWRFSQNAGVFKYRDSIYRNPDFITFLEIKPFSKYMDYLKDLGKNDPYFKAIQQEFDGAGNLMAGSAAWFEKNHKSFDFDIPKNRLWAAIYLLSNEETIEMKLDRYYKNK